MATAISVASNSPTIECKEPLYRPTTELGEDEGFCTLLKYNILLKDPILVNLSNLTSLNLGTLP